MILDQGHPKVPPNSPFFVLEIFRRGLEVVTCLRNWRPDKRIKWTLHGPATVPLTTRLRGPMPGSRGQQVGLSPDSMGKAALQPLPASFDHGCCLLTGFKRKLWRVVFFSFLFYIGA